MSEWMPGAVRRPQPGGVTLDTSLPPRGVWHITWDKLNADGSQPDFSAVAGYLINQQYCPNIMWNPFTGYMEQYYPASVGGRALKYNNQDGAACVQVEVFFTPGCVVGGVKYDTVADTPLVGWEDLISWMESLGIPRTWPMGAPQWSGNPRDADVWNGNAGHYGHCHSPGDTHTDPGPMPALDRGVTTQGTITQEADMPLSAEDTKSIIDGVLYAKIPKYNAAGAQVGTTTLAETAAWQEANFKSGRDSVGGLLASKLPAPDGSGKSYTLADYITYGWAYGMNAGPRTLGQEIRLEDGTVTTLASLLAAIYAKPAGTAAAVAQVDVDSLVARLKTELPPAVLAELTTKLTQ